MDGRLPVNFQEFKIVSNHSINETGVEISNYLGDS